MGIILLIILLALLFGGIGLSIQILWIVALVALVLLLAGNLSGPRGPGWYRW